MNAARHIAALDRLQDLNLNWHADEAGMAERRERFHRLRDRHQNGTAPRAVSSFNLFQTPTALALRMVELAGVRHGAAVLEPSAGLGRLVSPALDAAQGVCLTAVDNSPACCAELRLSFSRIEVRQADFLTMQAAPEFDRVLMNPPFHLRADIRHILHALKFLKRGGVLVAVCMAGPARESALRPLADVWEPLPANTFKTEGTSVDAVLLRIKL